MSNVPDLNERAQFLLKVLVQRYIGDGTPVGSRALARDAGLNLSAATIRNAMADLEDLGLIAAPHTSAGRIPTVSGYRFFVDSLLTVKPLQQVIMDQLWSDLETQDSPQDIFETASKLLSELTHMASVVTMPRNESVTLCHIEFLALSEHRVLVILVTSDQEVHNHIMQVPRAYSASELQTAANFLNKICVGKDLAALRRYIEDDLRSAREVLDSELGQAAELAGLALGINDRRKHPFLVSGETNLMDFSELADVEHLRGLFAAFKQKEDMLGLLDRCLESPGVKILIGEESGFQPLLQCSLVTSSYAVNDRVVGVLGVIGPTRMQYQRVIPLVDVTAKLLGLALNQRSLSPM
ncbi:MAG: heat-inducible transcription repressor HrcA [Pseudomonadota bacterium]|jgi:heat-inducible transcriptional repressor